MEHVHTLGALDYAVLSVYLGLMAGVGVFFGWFVKDISGYFKGGGVIPWPVAGISNYMSMFSTFVFVAYAGIAYEHGLVALTVIWCTVPPCILAALFLAGRWRRAELTTPVEYLEVRFGPAARQLFSWTGLVMRTLDNVVRMYAIGLFMASVVPLDLGTTILLSGLIITLYTVIGGLWAVAVLDTIQFVVLLLASLILFPLSLSAAGGLGHIAQVAPSHLHLLAGPKGAPLFLLAYYAMIMLKYNANWAFIQRLYCVRDERAARRVAWLCAILFFVTPILFVVPPLAARVVTPGLSNHEMAYVAISSKLLPPGLLGLMLAAMFSATMSSLNSEYNIMAGVVTSDIYKRLFVPRAGARHLVWAARVFTVLIGLGITSGALLVGDMGGAFEANKLFTGILAIPLAVPLLLGLWLRRPTTLALVLTVTGGAGLALLLNLWEPIRCWTTESLATLGYSAAWTLKGPSWEVATLVTIAASIAIFAGLGLVSRAGASRQALVAQFFEKLRTPLAEAQKPSIDPKFRRRLSLLFGASLLAVGLLYLVVSLASIDQPSGIVGTTAGSICAAAGGAWCLVTIRWKKGTGPICRNGPQGASHKLDLSPFSPPSKEKLR